MSRGRPATGSVDWRRNPRTGSMQWMVRLTLGDRSRPWVELDPAIPEHDREGAIACAKVVSGGTRASTAVSVRTVETVTEYAKRWLAAREDRGLTSVADDKGRLDTHVLPKLGARDVRSVMRDDLESLVEELDGKVRAGTISWKTATHAWGLVGRMFADASGAKRRDLRVREDNPANGVHAPDRGADKSKVYLYPAELSALVTCRDVPKRWRRMFAITTYLYARAGEVNALTWADVDLDHGVVHIHASVNRRTGALSTTKTEKTRRVPIDPALLPLLHAMHEEASDALEGRREEREARIAKLRVSPIEGTDRKLSRQLQRCLVLADVKRADLFANDASRKPITFHDLRATGITWCAVRGDDPLRIKQRAGHSSFSTTEGYIREAENLREANFGTPFPALPAELLEPSDEAPNRGGWEAGRGGRISSRISSRDETGVTIAGKNREKRWRRRESKGSSGVGESRAETCT